jgi:hypothetical protein
MPLDFPLKFAYPIFYGNTSDKGGWTEVFYPDSNTKRLRYYSQFFDAAEMDSIFYEKFYSKKDDQRYIYWDGEGYAGQISILS